MSFYKRNNELIQLIRQNAHEDVIIEALNNGASIYTNDGYVLKYAAYQGMSKLLSVINPVESFYRLSQELSHDECHILAPLNPTLTGDNAIIPSYCKKHYLNAIDSSIRGFNLEITEELFKAFEDEPLPKRYTTDEWSVPLVTGDVDVLTQIIVPKIPDYMARNSSKMFTIKPFTKRYPKRLDELFSTLLESDIALMILSQAYDELLHQGKSPIDILSISAPWFKPYILEQMNNI